MCFTEIKNSTLPKKSVNYVYLKYVAFHVYGDNTNFPYDFRKLANGMLPRAKFPPQVNFLLMQTTLWRSPIGKKRIQENASRKTAPWYLQWRKTQADEKLRIKDNQKTYIHYFTELNQPVLLVSRFIRI